MPHWEDPQLKALLALNRVTPGSVAVRRLLEDRTPPSEILEQIQSGRLIRNSEKTEITLRQFDAAREIELCHDLNVRCISILDSDYPSLLKHIPDAPLLLYVRGSFDPTDHAALAIVGSRHPSFYGLHQAKKFAKDLAQQGWTIVSGLARGIDEAAHQAALDVAYGRSLAVLGCGVDRVYPKENEKLFFALTERGAVLSEFPLGTAPLAQNFPRRNRIISGLSLGVLVVEAHARSGSLITAHEAIDQGREVFALPGPVDQLTSRGTHRLIKEGAALVETASDMIEALAYQIQPALTVLTRGMVDQDFKEKPIVPIPAEETTEGSDQAWLEKLLSGNPLSIQEIATQSEMQPARLASLITSLEIHRRIQKRPDGRFAKFSCNPGR